MILVWPRLVPFADQRPPDPPATPAQPFFLICAVLSTHRSLSFQTTFQLFRSTCILVFMLSLYWRFQKFHIVAYNVLSKTPKWQDVTLLLVRRLVRAEVINLANDLSKILNVWLFFVDQSSTSISHWSNKLIFNVDIFTLNERVEVREIWQFSLVDSVNVRANIIHCFAINSE